MGIRWLADNCLNASHFIAKIDDDVIVNRRELISYLGNMAKQTFNITNRFICYGWQNAYVQRSGSDKFYVPLEEYSAKYYPTYCDGPAYIYSNDMLLSLKNAINSINLFRFEDVYLGLLASKLKSEFITINERYSDENSVDELIRTNKSYSKFFFYPVGLENFAKIWKKINS